MNLLERFKVCTDLDICLSQLDRNDRLVVAISREHALNSRLISTSQIYCFKNPETIYDYTLSILMHENFPLSKELDEFIRIASASGLIKRWRLVSRIRNVPKYDANEIGILKLDSLFGLLVIYFRMVFLLFITFCLELIVHKMVKKFNSSKMWMHIEMLIDSDRHFLLENKCYWK